MFFRRAGSKEPSFEERLSQLRDSGFEVRKKESGRAVVIRGKQAAAVAEAAGGGVEIGRAGMILGDEVASMVSRGFQTVWRAGSGREAAARAEQLHEHHDFLEDLRELLGLTSFYNESLGTTHSSHHYDRVAGRE